MGVMLLFNLFSIIFTVCRNGIWMANGTYSELQRSREQYATSAHKFRILTKYYLDLVLPVTLKNFALVHEEFVHPDYVLNDCVTLLQITKDTAIFIEADSNKLPPSSPHFGFFGIGQMETGVKIITMPLVSFKRLGDELPENPSKLLFIHNIARSGTTLVSSVLSHTGRAVSLSEPRVLDSMCNLYGKAWSTSESKALFGHVIRLLIKPCGTAMETPLVYVIKPSSLNVPFAGVFHELFPSSVSIFVYRDLVETTLSGRLMLSKVPTLTLAYTLIDYGTDAMRQKATTMIGVSSKIAKTFKPKYEPTTEFIFFIYMTLLRHYLDLRANGVDVRGFRYEDFERQS